MGTDTRHKHPDISQEEILRLMLQNGLTLEKVIDVVVDSNAIIGVGLISLGDSIKDYIYHHPEKRLNPKIQF